MPNGAAAATPQRTQRTNARGFYVNVDAQNRIMGITVSGGFDYGLVQQSCNQICSGWNQAQTTGGVPTSESAPAAPPQGKGSRRGKLSPEGRRNIQLAQQRRHAGEKTKAKPMTATA